VSIRGLFLLFAPYEDRFLRRRDVVQKKAILLVAKRQLL
jgi:hypothetical protein